jgi:hypothetical protein
MTEPRRQAWIAHHVLIPNDQDFVAKPRHGRLKGSVYDDRARIAKRIESQQPHFQ